MTYLTVRARPRLAGGLLLGCAAVVAGCHTPGENGTEFTIDNRTGTTLSIVERHQPLPGQPVAEDTFSVPPGRDGVHVPLTRGHCVYVGFTAYDPTGKMVAAKPSPICEDPNGHGSTWTINAS